MIRLLIGIPQFIVSYVVLTMVEPFRVLFRSTDAFPRKQSALGRSGQAAKAPRRHPAPSVFRSLQRQRAMTSPKVDFVPLAPGASVTNEYLKRDAKHGWGEVPRSPSYLLETRPQNGMLH